LTDTLALTKRLMGVGFALLAALGATATAAPAGTRVGAALEDIEHVVVIYAENHSFDNLYGLFPGANGVSRATAQQRTQIDHDGKPLSELLVFGRDGKPDPAYPRLPNAPFRIDAAPVNRSAAAMVPSPTHDFFFHQEQINGGANNLFAAMSAVGGWTMGHYDGSSFKLWQWAREYTLADNFFQAAFGGSYLNHQWLICACTPRHAEAPASMRVRLDASGKLEKRAASPSASVGALQIVSNSLGRSVTPDGWSVNTTQPPYQPSGIPPAAEGLRTHASPRGLRTASFDAGEPLPPQAATTIGDTLSAKGVSWAWYAGGWNAALADGMQAPDAKRRIIYERAQSSPNFQPHHQPFNYFARYAPGTPERALHLKDGDDFVADIAAGRLPAVSFYKPSGRDSQHPSYTDILSGDAHMAGLLEKLRASAQWQRMLVIVTYDENGGYWDHVAPPQGPGWGDRWGPGSRIPALLIGPHVKRGFVDSTPYDTTSILKFISKRFDLPPLPGVRARMGDLTQALLP
jgi:acid phosphatase